MFLVFPDAGVDGSLHTAILVGLLVGWAVHERLGWVFAGFVVSGYLAALAIVAPPTLGVVALESVLTYALVRVVSDGLPALGVYSPVFGRERFLLFVVMSLPVRMVCTGLAMPRLSTWLVDRGLADASVQPELLGIGVVLVPLVANTFYKPGLATGLAQVGFTTGLTWALLTFVFGPFTNLGFDGFSETLDALSLGALPPSRAVLLLLVTAFVAARNNARYGWDFGGVLVPALLAMLALEPSRLVATLGEVALLYALWTTVLKLPIVASLDLGGPRRIVAVYVLSWGLHQVVAWTALALDLPVVVGDVFGFGYLLTSLVVTRCQKAGLVPTLVPLVATAGQGTLAAAAIAALLVTVAPTAPAPRPIDQRVGFADARAAVVDMVAEAGPQTAPVDAGAGAAWAAPAGEEVQAGACRLRPVPLASVLDCPGDGPVLVIAQPVDDPDAGWLGGWLASQTDAGAVVIAATDPTGHPGGVAPAATVKAAMTVARSVANGRPVVAVGSTPRGAEASPALWVRGDLRVGSLLGEVSGLRLRADAPPSARSALWDTLRDGEALILLPATSPRARGDDRPLPHGDLVRAATTVTATLLRHGDALALEPDALAWLAELAGARVSMAHDPDGSPVIEVVVADPEGGRDTVLVRPGGAPWVVMTEAAQRWPGADATARWVAQGLRARVTWIAAPEARSQRRVAWQGSPSTVDRVVRALLPADAPVTLVLVGALPQEHGPVEVAVGPRVDGDALDATLAAWPGRVTTSLAASDRGAPLAEAAYRQQALGLGVAVVGLPRARLREADPAERARLVAWHHAQGLADQLRDGPELGEALTSGPAREVSPAPYPLVQHAELLSAATARALAEQHAPGTRLGVLEVGPRLVFVAQGGGQTCAAVAGATGGAWPFAGCRSGP